MFLNNAQCSSPSEIVDQFANFFKSVYVHDVVSPSSDLSNCYNNNLNISDLLLSRNCVIHALIDVDERKGCGPANIPPVFLKRCVMQLATPLQYIFNTSLKSGTFPKKWKTSFIVYQFLSQGQVIT